MLNQINILEKRIDHLDKEIWMLIKEQETIRANALVNFQAGHLYGTSLKAELQK
jgi:hypothetical protein